MKPYLSIDIETTGLDPSFCQILEIGAVLDDWVTPIADLPKFNCYVTHQQIIGEPYGLSMNSEILRRISKHEKPYLYLSEKKIALFLKKWLIDCKYDITRHILAAGKNFASFDRQFLLKLPRFSEYITFQHRTIDPAMFYYDLLKDKDGPPSTKTCMERAGIAGEVTHNAVDDAIVVCKLIRFHFLVADALEDLE